MKACTTPRTMLGADCVRRKGKEGTGTICRQPFVVFLDLWGKDSHFGLMKLKRTLSSSLSSERASVVFWYWLFE